MPAPAEATELFEAAKANALPGVWNQGVKLARNEAAQLESRSDQEIVLRVASPGRAIAPTVVLYPEETEWACDCAGRNDPCEHAVAAIISLYQGQFKGQSSRAAKSELWYRLCRERGQLKIRRFLISEDGEHELSESLTSLVARGACPFSPSQDDVQVDRLISAMPRGDFKLPQIKRLFQALETLKVEFEGKPVRARGEPLKPLASVFDKGDRIVLSVTVDPSVDEVVFPGIVRAGDELRPIGAVEVCGLRLERLPLERSMRQHETAELVERVLPELSKTIDIDVRSRRLPQRSKNLKPWIAFDLSHHGHSLSVLPTLVYGDPPVARVDAGALVLLSKTAPKRNRSVEASLNERLRDELNLALGRRVHFDGEQAARMAERLRVFQSKTGTSHPWLSEVPSLTPRLSLDPEQFDVTFEVAAPTPGQAPVQASTQAVLKAWRDGAELVPLSEGGFASVPRQWLDQHAEQVIVLLTSKQEHGRIPTFAVPTLAKLCSELREPPPPGLQELAPLFAGFEALPPASLPADLTAQLRPYQLEAVRWLSFLRDTRLGAVLADDMGLGKTLQTLCAISGRTLVVCPRSVLFNWEGELARFRPGLRTCTYHGRERHLDLQADVTLTTYAVLRLDTDALVSSDWHTIVLDEAQAIKNPDSQVTQAAFRLQAQFKVALSGTPIENRLDELWSIFRFTHPGLLGTRVGFDERFARPMAQGDPSATLRLRELTKPFLLRRLKSVVAKELPPRTDVILPIGLHSREQDLYDAVLAATKREVVQELRQGGNVFGALEALLRLRQAACHSGLLPGQAADSSSKTEALVDALCDVTANGHKALVFSQWTSFLDKIEPHLTEAQIGYLRLDGATRDRGAVVQKFQDAGGPPVLLASLKAGGTGLNLTAADHVFLMDPWYNPATEDQAADRAHRIGQDRPVMVYKLVAKGTVEEKIVGLQEKKRQIAAGALSGAAAATQITRDDLLALLE